MEHNCCVTPTEELIREREEIVRDAHEKFDNYIFTHIEMLKTLSLDENAEPIIPPEYESQKDKIGQLLVDIIQIQERVHRIDELLKEREESDGDLSV